MSKSYNKWDAAWDKMYSYAEQYYSEYGNLKVPQKYKTADGHNLGRWINMQRMIYKGKASRKNPTLEKDKIEKLEAIGMVWGDVNDIVWQRHYEAAKAYYEEHGNLDMTYNYVTQDGIKLGAWLHSQRSYRNGTIKNDSLTEERIAALDKIGMVWKVLDSWWEEKFKAAEEFYRENGHLKVTYGYRTANGVNLGDWIWCQRLIRAGKINGGPLTEEQIARLDSIGMIWEKYRDIRWEEKFKAAEEFYRENGHLKVNTRYCTPNGIRLGQWVLRQRMGRAGKIKNYTPLTKEQIERLDKIGMIWTTQKPSKRK